MLALESRSVASDSLQGPSPEYSASWDYPSTLAFVAAAAAAACFAACSASSAFAAFLALPAAFGAFGACSLALVRESPESAHSYPASAAFDFFASGAFAASLVGLPASVTAASRDSCCL